MDFNTNTLFNKIEKHIRLQRMVEDVHAIAQWHRYTGESGGEAFVDWLLLQLNKETIPYSVETYEPYCSLPLDASVSLPDGKKVKAIADVYSKTVENLAGDLIFDKDSLSDGLNEYQERERFASFKGKIVLSYSSGGDFAENVYLAGGKGLIHINPSKGGYIHHHTDGSEWGNPASSHRHFLCQLPAVGISLEDGESLVDALKENPLSVSITANVNTRVKTSRMVVVDIPGKMNSFVMLNGHYDSWYEGVTDNAAADAILLEFARAFWSCRNELDRGIRICWWSGHSDARYAGSAWYCDHHYLELNKNCVGNINLDLCGCKLSRQIRARTTLMEGPEMSAELIRKYTGMKAKPYIPMIRGADMSFWGVRIPIVMMFKYEPTDEDRVSSVPSGGPWWHTDEDTIDKLDESILLRDALINAEFACKLVNAEVLPVKIPDFLAEMIKFLHNMESDLSADFDLTETINRINQFKTFTLSLESELKALPRSKSDSLLKIVAGELIRLTYSQGSAYDMDRATSYAPFGVLGHACGKSRENTPLDSYVFQMTEFRRAQNRIEGQLLALKEVIELHLNRDCEQEI